MSNIKDFLFCKGMLIVYGLVLWGLAVWTGWWPCFVVGFAMILYCFIYQPIRRIFIYKGWHRQFMFISSLLFSKSYTRIFELYGNSMYDETLCTGVNKLFGYTPRWFPAVSKLRRDQVWFRFGAWYVYLPHHWESYRYGWTALKQENKFRLYSYIYQQGVRTIKHLVDVRSDQRFICKFEEGRVNLLMGVLDYRTGELLTTSNVMFYKARGFRAAWKLGAYFGGQKKAPQTIELIKQNR